MWFKNLKIYKINMLDQSLDSLDEIFAKNSLRELGSHEIEVQGWIPPKKDTDSYVYKFREHLMICLAQEKKLLPATVINQYLNLRSEAYTDQKGQKPGRKLLKEMKEAVVGDLIPKAFSLLYKTYAWIDLVHGWLVIDTTNVTKADELVSFLRKSYPDFELSSLNTKTSGSVAMTEWVITEAPTFFTVDKDCELRGSDIEKSTIRYVRHSLDSKEIQNHIRTGKEVTKLALTWNDKLSFVLTENLQVKKIIPLDILKENAESDEDIFDSDFAIMTGELSQLIADLVGVLDGVAE
ncbi:recombination-associated protein RdgC [Nitrosovibrio tenuis]|uniref:Recombination-associated protein RdgC n=1 Tax=Nitrosovibrio tenuis TaxID=1233 RepID=A0A1H7P9T1_9PROT|nr:recombination-associated protein RdgC [Nitrosovibrio tenuis]SEL32188.1 recombination associated protein RdgC [Nitrosovibrio tenuis]